MLYSLVRGHEGLAMSNGRCGLGLTGPADPRAAATAPMGVRVGPFPPDTHRLRQPSALSAPVKPLRLRS
jgi:hypothetical protein